MRWAGFVLVGGRSTRMGRDKALLDYHGMPLAGHLATLVQQAVGSVTLIGSPALYGELALPILDDWWPNCGPLGGLHRALVSAKGDWNLLIACDLPHLSSELLSGIVDRASHHGGNCVAAMSSAGVEPLCAAYRSTCLAEVTRRLIAKRLKMRELVHDLDTAFYPAQDCQLLNTNTPEQWTAAKGA